VFDLALRLSVEAHIMFRSLATSMVVVLLVGPPVRADEAAAVKALTKLGAKIKRDDKAPGKPVVEVDLSKGKFKDGDLKELAALEELRVLSLRGTTVSNKGLKELAGLTKLERLDLGFTTIGDEGLKELAPLTKLRYLDLYTTKVTDKGMKELAPLKELRFLNLPFTGIGDAGLKELAVLKELENLDVTGTRVTAAGVKSLQKSLPKCKIRTQ
jgi:hypothetical protein